MSENQEYPHVRTVYIEPTTVDGYWVSTIEMDKHTTVGTWRSTTKSHAEFQAEEAMIVILEQKALQERRARIREELHARRRKTLWGRLLNLVNW